VELLKAIELTPDIPISRIGNLAKLAESSGFDAIFVSCHYNNRDPFITLAHLATLTDSLRIGPGVVNPYTSHILTLASQMASLSEISNGRAILGIGAGDRSTLSHFNIERSNPLRNISKTIELLKSLWDGNTVTNIDSQKTLSMENASLNFPVENIPIYIGTQGENILKLSTSIANGALFNTANINDLLIAHQQVQTSLSSSKIPSDEFDFSAQVCVSVDSNLDKAKEAVLPPVAFIVGGASTEFLQSHNIDLKTSESIRNSIQQGQFKQAFNQVNSNMINEFSICGTPDTVYERLSEIYECTNSLVVGYPIGPDLETAIPLIGSFIE
jgi:5,10-methylenetetrahydromethanopterin reductase